MFSKYRSCMGHVSVEVQESAQRVVEAHFPGAIAVSDVRDVDEIMVQHWATLFSQASLVLIGGGPPCQGVSGLNCDRKGGIRDSRSNTFLVFVAFVRKWFPWCQVHTFMESVASMDAHDRNVMSEGFGQEPISCNAGEIFVVSHPALLLAHLEP